MNSAEFKTIRRILGITTDEVAATFGVALRSARRWESTHQPPDDAVDWLERQLDIAHSMVTDFLYEVPKRSETFSVPVYRTDEEATAALGQHFTKERHMAIVGLAQFMADHEQRAGESLLEPRAITVEFDHD